MPSIHFEIPKLSVILRKEYLYDMFDKGGEYVPAELFAVSSYPGDALTFDAMVDGKYLFHYLPVNAFAVSPCNKKTLVESCYFNCPSGDLAVTKFTNLSKCRVFSKNKYQIGSGTYQMTFDWYNDNELCHLVALDEGNLVLVPSHKLVFSEKSFEALPDYKKLHSSWRV